MKTEPPPVVDADFEVISGPHEPIVEWQKPRARKRWTFGRVSMWFALGLYGTWMSVLIWTTYIHPRPQHHLPPEGIPIRAVNGAIARIYEAPDGTLSSKAADH